MQEGPLDKKRKKRQTENRTGNSKNKFENLKYKNKSLCISILLLEPYV